ncbi:hypothetical protein [Dyadobacter psychrotolerans]|uniref:DUF4380 domain-containing protein n=1 Tax=Dyadobacter psychrotolerans TaxID=2541721 RepID=A0A4R5DNP1_9BACT|nr:hypothetical protein [Dyadobacter psychrotolerans]TDE12333.1 hypothetical protein E0F88_21775 [Dyadobacter psychrotolerans]
MKKLLATGLLLYLCCGMISSADFPMARISNGLIEADLYLPDAESGYYRGTRFDWAGVIPKLEFKGHNFFGQWFSKYDPKLHDAIMGPVEEFTAIGFEEAQVGAEFLKIGVGTLVRPDEKVYSFSKTYEIKNPGKWKIKKRKDRIEFTHEISDAAGYAYQYRKTVKLKKGKPELVLEHTIKNTGRKAIETNVYNHNFFMIDNEPTNQNIKTTFPFKVVAEGKNFGNIAVVDKESITYARTLEQGENVFSSGLQGFGKTKKDYNIFIDNQKSGAGVRITGDQPLEKIVFWACHTTSCPEPYIKLSVKPGEKISWIINYEFSVTN